MPSPATSRRLTLLEHRLTQLEDSAGALRADLSAFRAEMRGEFAAFRAEMQEGFAAVRAELADVRVEIHEMREELGASIMAANEETRRHMRVLHEDLVARIATIGEAGPRGKLGS